MFSLDNVLVPFAAILMSPVVDGGDLQSYALPSGTIQSRGAIAPCWADPVGLASVHQPDPLQQIRIERRVIVRVVPFPSPRRGADLADEAQTALAPPRYEERRAIRCVAIRDISGVRQASGNRLVLFMRGNRPVSARLEKRCSARDYYSGFYVEASEDGQLCTGRDALHSRAGTNCTLARLHRLEPAEE